ncbi:MAG: sodium:proton exchanger, partial [Clostridiales bacterium]|nr:sodium:proton exchanger [Clostridiales bacterium]
MLKTTVLFLVGFLLLIKGGDWFVDGSTGIAKRLHVPELLIGATIVSIGTTLPEVMVSSTAVIHGNGAMSYGNAIGSVICNTALISALTVAIRPGKADSKSLRIPVCFFFAAAVFYAAVAYFAPGFERWTGILLLCVFIAYMGLTVWRGKKHYLDNVSSDDDPEDEGEGDIFERLLRKWFNKKLDFLPDVILLVIGAAFIAIGARLLVDNGRMIAEALGVPDTVIALTLVALGTSLPELVTAVTALLKGHSALSLGNIIGANLFNIVLVSGMAVTLRPFAVPNEKQFAGMNASLVIDLPLMFAVMLILTVPALLKG